MVSVKITGYDGKMVDSFCVGLELQQFLSSVRCRTSTFKTGSPLTQQHRAEQKKLGSTYHSSCSTLDQGKSRLTITD